MSKLFKIRISFNECDLSFPRCLDLGALRVHLLLFWFAEFLIWLHFKGGTVLGNTKVNSHHHVVLNFLGLVISLVLTI